MLAIDVGGRVCSSGFDITVATPARSRTRMIVGRTAELPDRSIQPVVVRDGVEFGMTVPANRLGVIARFARNRTLRTWQFRSMLHLSRRVSTYILR